MPARKPAAILELNGAFDRNPSRRREDPVNDQPIGAPPEHLTDDERQAWAELVDEQYPGVFNKSHRKAVENASRAIAKIRNCWTLDVAKEVRIMLSTLGMDPVNCGKLATKTDKPNTTTSGFTQLK